LAVFLEVVEVVLVVAFLAGAFFFAAAALAFDEGAVPVAAFLAAPRLEGDAVFFAGEAFFAGAAFLAGAALGLAGAALGLAGAALGLAGAALGLAGAAFAALALLAATVRAVPVVLGAGFFVVPVLAAVLVAVVRGLGAGFFALAVLVAVALAGFALAGALAFDAGLFSLVAEVSLLPPLGESFTRPEGPLGRTNVPFSAPLAIALLSWVFCALPISTLYWVSTNFLI